MHFINTAVLLLSGREISRVYFVYFTGLGQRLGVAVMCMATHTRILSAFTLTVVVTLTVTDNVVSVAEVVRISVSYFCDSDFRDSYCDSYCDSAVSCTALFVTVFAIDRN